MSDLVQAGERVLSDHERVPRSRMHEELLPYSYMVVDPEMSVVVRDCLFASTVEEWVPFEGRESGLLLSQNVPPGVVRVITRVGISLWGAGDVPILSGGDVETRFRVTPYENDKIVWKLAHLWLVPGQVPVAPPTAPSGDPVRDALAQIERRLARMDQQLENIAFEQVSVRDRLPLLSFPKIVVAGKPLTVQVEGAEGVTRGLVMLRGWNLRKPGGIL